MLKTDIAVIGGGPAGLCAAIAAASSGARVTLIDRNAQLGGQLLKQTHMFFGSVKQHASVRGFDIAKLLTSELERYRDLIEVLTDSTALGLYEDGVLTVERERKYLKIKPSAIIGAIGASEKHLAFPGNDLPGIYGAGAVQTLMNQYGVAPGKSAVMVGAGNIGLIVSYQLLQAGIKVKAVIDAAPKIGGYLVHAAKIRRAGVPIHTSTTVQYAHGAQELERVTLSRLDGNWQSIPGSEFDVETDVLCIAVGLTPLAELLWQIGCEMRYVPELGGHVPLRNGDYETTVPNVYVAGDVAGIEEASSAMVEGRLAGLCAARNLGLKTEAFESEKQECLSQLQTLRSGPSGEKILRGLEKTMSPAILQDRSTCR
jgi:sarcosine oxidase, subunit alpha